MTLMDEYVARLAEEEIAAEPERVVATLAYITKAAIYLGLDVSSDTVVDAYLTSLPMERDTPAVSEQLRAVARRVRAQWGARPEGPTDAEWEAWMASM